MVLGIAGNMRRIAYLILAAETYTLKDVHKIFSTLADFIKNEPDGSFEGKQITDVTKKHQYPLYLTDEGKASLKAKLSKYPQLISSGETGGEHFSFPYTVGQFLAIVAMKQDLLEQVDPQKGEKSKSAMNDLFKVWNSHENMNARGVYDMVEDKNIPQAKKLLGKKLDQSASITQELS